MQVHLKVKIKSLVAEAQFIRREEQKVSTNYRHRKRLERALDLRSIPSGKDGSSREILTQAQLDRIQKKLDRARAQFHNNRAGMAFNSLRDHRKNEVRSHARSSFLAYGFIRGLEYKQIENLSYSEPDWMEVRRLIEKFSEEGSQTWAVRFEEFKQQAEDLRATR